MTEPTSPAPPPPPPTAPTPPAAPPKKKGLSPLAWVGIGCLVLLFIGAIGVFSCTAFFAKKAKDFVEEASDNPAKAAAEMMVKLNPELELVESDDAAGTMTVRNTATGEVVTVDFEELKEGRFRFETDEGETTVEFQDESGAGGLTITGPEGKTARIGATEGGEQIPSWVPRYPGATGVATTFTIAGDDGESGMFTWKTSEGVDEAAEKLRGLYEDAGFEVTVQSISVGDSGKQVFVTGEDGGRTVNSTLSAEEGATQGLTQYSSGG